MSAAPSTQDPSATLEDAITAGIAAREAAEHALYRSRAQRSRAADALEHAAQREGCDETERSLLRAAYTAAARAVARRQADLDRARELEHAWTIVTRAYDDAPAASHPAIAAALHELLGSMHGTHAGSSHVLTTRGRARRSEPVTRPRGARPRPA